MLAEHKGHILIHEYTCRETANKPAAGCQDKELDNLWT